MGLAFFYVLADFFLYLSALSVLVDFVIGMDGMRFNPVLRHLQRVSVIFKRWKA